MDLSLSLSLFLFPSLSLSLFLSLTLSLSPSLSLSLSLSPSPSLSPYVCLFADRVRATAGQLTGLSSLFFRPRPMPLSSLSRATLVSLLFLPPPFSRRLTPPALPTIHIYPRRCKRNILFAGCRRSSRVSLSRSLVLSSLLLLFPHALPLPSHPGMLPPRPATTAGRRCQARTTRAGRTQQRSSRSRWRASTRPS